MKIKPFTLNVILGAAFASLSFFSRDAVVSAWTAYIPRISFFRKHRYTDEEINSILEQTTVYIHELKDAEEHNIYLLTRLAEVQANIAQSSNIWFLEFITNSLTAQDLYAMSRVAIFFSLTSLDSELSPIGAIKCAIMCGLTFRGLGVTPFGPDVTASYHASEYLSLFIVTTTVVGVPEFIHLWLWPKFIEMVSSSEFKGILKIPSRVIWAISLGCPITPEIFREEGLNKMREDFRSRCAARVLEDLDRVAANNKLVKFVDEHGNNPVYLDLRHSDLYTQVNNDLEQSRKKSTISRIFPGLQAWFRSWFQS